MKAIKITTDGEVKAIEVDGLRGMQKAVGGYIQTVRSYFLNNLVVPDNKSLLMIVNEDGKNLGLDYNEIATTLYGAPYDDIVGDALIMAEGFVDGEADIVGLTDEQIKALKKYF